MEHLFNCKYLNIAERVKEYLKIFTGNAREQRTVLHRFEKKLNIIEKKKEESSNIILHSEPPSCILY